MRLENMNKETIESDEETFKQIFNTWGSYTSLKKDVALMEYFLKNPEKIIRQKTIIDHFKNEMAAETCRKHLYKLVEKELIEESKEFRGSYFCRHSDEEDSLYYFCDVLIERIIGPRIYEMAKRRWKKLYELH